MNRGDIYLVSLDPTVGHEQQGKRPVLIVSPYAFNAVTKIPLVCPITSNTNSFASKIGFAVTLKNTKTMGIVRCDQLRAIDLNNRNAKKLESV